MQPIVGRRRWLEDRVAFLTAELARTEDPSVRVLIETELDLLASELDDARRGSRRWLIFGGLLRRE